MLIQRSNLGHIVAAVVAAGLAIAGEPPAWANASVQHQAGLMPSTLMAEAAASGESVGTIVDVAVSNDAFSILVDLLQTAGLVDVLQGDGPFTVFAPTNEAFEALPAGTIDSLKENKELLTQILTYHVVAGEVTSNEIQPGEATTVAQLPLQLNVASGQVTVNDATVVAPDVAASNGVIHVIDSVLLPTVTE